jgi:hypothetical protein
MLASGAAHPAGAVDEILAKGSSRQPAGVREDGSIATLPVPRKSCHHPAHFLQAVFSSGELVAYLCTECDTQLDIHFQPSDGDGNG